MQRKHYRHESFIASPFDEDRCNMLKLPETPYEVATYTTVKADAYAKFSLNAGRHLYSTSPKYANSHLLVKMTAHEVIALDEEGRQIVSHRRLYGPNCQESMKWLPYLLQIARRPRALKYSGVYEMLPQSFREYLDGSDKATLGKVLKSLALLCSKGSFETTVKVVAEAALLKAHDIESLFAIHSRMTDMTPQLEAVMLPEGTLNLLSHSLTPKATTKCSSKEAVNVLKEEIAACCKALKLGQNLVENYDKVKAISHEEYLLELLKLDVAHRKANRNERLLKKSGVLCDKDLCRLLLRRD